MMNKEERNKVRHIMRNDTYCGERIYTERTRITARYEEKTTERVYALLKEACPERKITKRKITKKSSKFIEGIHRITIYI